MTDRIRHVKFSPAWDKRSPDPGKNYGIGAMKVVFALQGPLVTVQFVLSTGWYLPGNRDALRRQGQARVVPETDPEILRRKQQYSSLFGRSPDTREVVEVDRYWAQEVGKPTGYDVGYHSSVALYEDQSRRDDCEYLPGGCYYDGSGLRACEWVEKFIEGGENWLWPELEKDLLEREAQARERLEDQGRFS